MATNSAPLESDNSREAKKKPEGAHERLHKDGYSHLKSEKHNGSDKNVHHMSIVDKHGHPVAKIHHVKKGETLSTIARHELKQHQSHPTSKQVGRFAHRIAHANDLKAPYTIHPGQELLIPGHQRHVKPGAATPGYGAEAQKHRHVKPAGESTSPAATEKRYHHHEPKPGEAPTGSVPHVRPTHRHEAPPVSRPAHHARRSEGPSRPAPQPSPNEAPPPVAPRQDVQPKVAPRPDAQPPAAPRPDAQPPVGPKPLFPLPAAATDKPPQAIPVPDVQPPNESDNPNANKGILAGKVIVIDPGHGGQDSGAVGGGVAEKSITPIFAAQLAQKLQAAGATVVFTRPLQDNPSMPGGTQELQRRAALANRAHPDAIIRIHANAPSNSGDTGTSGLEAWWDQPKDQALTDALHASVARSDAQQGEADRGMRQKTDHYKFQPQAPSALLELGYITNPQDRARLLDRSYQDKTTTAMVQGLVNYFQSRQR